MSNAQLAIAAEQGDLLAWMESKPPEAFGLTYDPFLDGLRSSDQMRAVWSAMRHGDWVTIIKLRETVEGMDTSISARIRGLRTWLEETGRGTVDSERVTNSLWRYRIVRTWPIKGIHYR